jgi:hypothetical protein
MVSVTTYQTFEHKGQRWTRHPAVAEEAYVLGCDLGQSQDPTALIVLHHTKTPLDTWTVNEKALKTVQDVQKRFDCVVAERVPLNTSYPDIVAYVAELLSRPAIAASSSSTRAASAALSATCSRPPACAPSACRSPLAPTQPSWTAFVVGAWLNRC